MEKLKNLKYFKDLDDLLERDYINGNLDLSKSVLEKSASLLIKYSKTIQNRPFRDSFLLYNEDLEKNINGINKFLDGLKGNSLQYLNVLVGRDLYRFDSKEYEVSVIADELKDEKISYFWKHRSLKDKEIDLIENQKNEDDELKKERLSQALELRKMADSHYLAYKIKKNSKIFQDENSGQILFYLIRNNAKNLNFLQMNKKELSNLYKALNGKRLFIIDKNDVYSIEYKNQNAYLLKHKNKDDADSLILGLIDSKYGDGMYG